MKTKKDFIMLMYAFFLNGITLCSLSADLFGWNYTVTKMLSFVIAWILMCFAINVLRQNTACWKRNTLVALFFLTGFGIMVLVMRFFDTSVQFCMQAALGAIGCFLFFVNELSK